MLKDGKRVNGCDQEMLKLPTLLLVFIHLNFCLCVLDFVHLVRLKTAKNQCSNIFITKINNSDTANMRIRLLTQSLGMYSVKCWVLGWSRVNHLKCEKPLWKTIKWKTMVIYKYLLQNVQLCISRTHGPCFQSYIDKHFQWDASPLQPGIKGVIQRSLLHWLTLDFTDSLPSYFLMLFICVCSVWHTSTINKKSVEQEVNEKHVDGNYNFTCNLWLSQHGSLWALIYFIFTQLWIKWILNSKIIGF